MPPDDPPVLHLTDESRFVVRLGDAEAELVYGVRGDRMILVHTGVPEELGGRGLGHPLVNAAVGHAASQRLVVAPWCPFARRLLEQHPEMAAGVQVDWAPPPGNFWPPPPERPAGLERAPRRAGGGVLPGVGPPLGLGWAGVVGRPALSSAGRVSGPRRLVRYSTVS